MGCVFEGSGKREAVSGMREAASGKRKAENHQPSYRLPLAAYLSYPLPLTSLTLCHFLLTAGLVFLILWLTATPAQGATLNGRLTTSGYTWRAGDARHLRLYQTAILTAGQMGGGAFSLHAHVQVTGDVINEVSGREHYRFYSAYAQYRPGPVGMDVRIGRQRIFAGVGSGTIDGVRAEVAPMARLRLTGYAGLLAPLKPDGIGTWDEGNLWGGQALLDFDRTYVGISYAERSRAPLAYLGPGRYTGLLLNGDNAQFRRLGLDARREFGRASLYGRVDMDVAHWNVQALELSGDVRVSPKLHVSAEFQHRRPTLYLNSIFSVFEVSNDREVALRARYRMSDRIQVLAHSARVFYDGDHSFDVGAGVSVGQAYVGYARRSGYGGHSDAVAASLSHPITSNVSLRTDGSVSSYRLFDGQIRRDRAMAGSLGMRYRPRRTAMIDAEVQVLRNAFYNRDVRVFVRGSFWFFKRRQGQ